MGFPNLEGVTIEGFEPSWADLTVSATPSGLGLAGLVAGSLLSIADIKSFNSGVTVEVGSARGASGGRRRKRTTGQRDENASIELYRSGYQKLQRSLIPFAPRRNGKQAIIGLVPFLFRVAYSVPGDPEVYETICKGCRITGRELNDTEGSDPTVVSVTLNPIEIVDMVDGIECVLL
jgi:hypothetical protein